MIHDTCTPVGVHTSAWVARGFTGTMAAVHCVCPCVYQLLTIYVHGYMDGCTCTPWGMGDEGRTRRRGKSMLRCVVTIVFTALLQWVYTVRPVRVSRSRSLDAHSHQPASARPKAKVENENGPSTWVRSGWVRSDLARLGWVGFALLTPIATCLSVRLDGWMAAGRLVGRGTLSLYTV